MFDIQPKLQAQSKTNTLTFALVADMLLESKVSLTKG